MQRAKPWTLHPTFARSPFSTAIACAAAASPCSSAPGGGSLCGPKQDLGQGGKAKAEAAIENAQPHANRGPAPARLAGAADASAPRRQRAALASRAVQPRTTGAPCQSPGGASPGRLPAGLPQFVGPAGPKRADPPRAYNRATYAVDQTRRVTHAAEWLLDNFYLIEEQIQMARRHLPRGYSRELPRLRGRARPPGFPAFTTWCSN